MSQNLSHAVMAQRHEPASSLDLFPTPPWATRALCEFIDGEIGCVDTLSVWEPACGYGDMARPLGEYFRIVFASDVYPHAAGIVLNDFLLPGKPPFAPDWIITNPPFRLASEFVRTSLEIAAKGVAMLVRTVFLEGQERYEKLFEPYPPSHILQFTERVPMHKGKLTATGSTATAYCWVIWAPTIHHAPSFHWIAPCRKRLERPEDYAGAAE